MLLRCRVLELSILDVERCQRSYCLHVTMYFTPVKLIHKIPLSFVKNALKQNFIPGLKY